MPEWNQMSEEDQRRYAFDALSSRISYNEPIENVIKSAEALLGFIRGASEPSAPPLREAA